MSDKGGVRLVLEKSLIGASLVPDRPDFRLPRGRRRKHKWVGEIPSGG